MGTGLLLRSVETYQHLRFVRQDQKQKRCSLHRWWQQRSWFGRQSLQRRSASLVLIFVHTKLRSATNIPVGMFVVGRKENASPGSCLAARFCVCFLRPSFAYNVAVTKVGGIPCIK